MKKILLSLLCVAAILGTANAQICDGPLTVEIQGSVSTTPLEATEGSVDQPSCAGPTGAISVDVSGGTPDYSYSWTKDEVFFSDAEDLVDVGAGTYALEVTDASGCTTTLGPWTLVEPSDLVVAGETTDSDCNVAGAAATGAIELTVTGGTGTPAYSWTTSNGSGLVADAQNQSGLSAGTYVVVVTDESDCSKEATFTITAPEAFEVEVASVDPNCNATNGDENGSITLTVTGGTGDYGFAWSTTDGDGLVADAQNQTGLTAGTYSVVITDENDCSISQEVTLTGAEPMSIVAETASPTCHSDNSEGDGSISVEVLGGSGTYTYLWTTSDGSGLVADAQNQVGLTAGTYNVEVSDDNGCTTSEEIVLQGPEAIEAVAVVESPGCFGEADGMINVTSVTGGAGTAIGDYTLVWTTEDGSGLTAGAAIQTGLSAGIYNLAVTDANGCSEAYEYEITEPSEIVLQTEDVQQLSCHANSGPADGAISISVTGGSGVYTFAWTTSGGSGLVPDAQDQTGLSAGTYSVAVSDGTGCVADEQFILVAPAVVAIGHTVIPPSCAGDNGSIWTAVSGGQGAAPSDYTYTWTTENGSGLTAGTIHQQNVGPGTYNLTVSDANGCSNAAEFTVEDPAGIEGTVDVSQAILCNGDAGEITVAATGGTAPYTYSLEDGDFVESATFTNVEAGEYTVTVKDANGCTKDIDFTVDQPAQLMAGTCTEVMDLCQVSEGEIKVEVEGGVAPYQVTWTSANGGILNEASGQEIDTDGGSFTFTGAEGGKTYSFIVTDANGCQIP